MQQDIIENATNTQPKVVELTAAEKEDALDVSAVRKSR